MVLDISRTLVEDSRSLELSENGLVGLSHNVGKHVESTSMGHTDNNVLDSGIDGSVDQSLHTDNDSLGTLKTESLVVGELGGKEGLEEVSPDKSVEHSSLLVRGVVVRLGGLDSVSDPLTLLSRGNMDVLNTVGATVDSFTVHDNLTESSLVLTVLDESGEDTGAESDLGVEILVGPSVELEGQLLRGLLVLVGAKGDSKRINLGLGVTSDLVGSNQQLGLHVVGDVRRSAGGGSGGGNTSRGRGHNSGRGRECLVGRKATIQVLEVRLS